MKGSEEREPTVIHAAGRADPGDGARQRQRGLDAEEAAQLGHRLGEGGHVVTGSDGMMRGRLASAQAEMEPERNGGFRT